MKKSKDELVIPGDEVGTHEEWMPGKGTYEEKGIIYAKSFGRVEYDEDKLEARVKPFNPVTEVKEGDIIYGTIRDRRKSITTLDIAMVEGSTRGIAMDMEGTLHISKISDDYTENIKDKYLKGDVVRAKVTQTSPSIQLTTMGSDLGVVRGYCYNCRRGMERTGDTLYCPHCDRRETRKLSKLYGRITLKSK
ncbi:MAG: exosome complex RNA-binding protein Csl4 [Thermoplasmata archaeon]